MRIEETFVVARPPEIVFDYMVDPANLAAWQTSKTLVEPLSEGPTRLGSRVRERTKPPGAREFEQIVEFTEFDRPHRFHVHVVEGPQPVDGTWTFAPEGDGTRVRFAAAGELRGPMRLLGPVVARAMARQFAGYHRTLRANLETAAVR
jgi:uncharacterized protein YndB with AHSA1/START domain